MVATFSIIILNHNGIDDLRECLPSVFDIDDPNFEVLVVDNGSTDGSCEFVEEHFPKVGLLRNGHNIGFAAGNNRGLDLCFAKGAGYAVLLNNDTKVNRKWLLGFREAFASDPAIGICGAKILDWEGQIIEFDGTIFNPVNASGGYLDQAVDEYGGTDTVREIAYACGGSLAISRECYESIGGFDEAYFIYNEDIDMSLQAWIHGFRVVYTPRSETYHRRGACIRRFQKSTFRDYLGMRNALTTVLKDYELATFRCIYRDLIRIYILSGNWILLKGVLYNLLVLPRTLLKRRKIQLRRVRSDNDIFVRTSKPYPETNTC